MSIQTGYEDDKHDDEKKLPPPEEVEWKVEHMAIGSSEEDKAITYVRVEVGGKTLGMLRLPNTEYLRWLRERLAHE